MTCETVKVNANIGKNGKNVLFNSFLHLSVKTPVVFIKHHMNGGCISYAIVLG